MRTHLGEEIYDWMMEHVMPWILVIGIVTLVIMIVWAAVGAILGIVVIK
jgi:uncharacterized membrane protein